MARQKGVFKFKGTIDGVTYYESKYGPLVRRKGGPSAEQFKNAPNFKRAREQNKEFGSCGTATKVLRWVLMPLMREARDFQVTARLVKLMFAIKNLDTIAARGERSVAQGIASPSAKDAVKGFDFNEKAKLERVLKKPCTVDTSTGVIKITGLNPKDDLDCPSGATHVRFTGGWARIDFATMPGKGELILSNQVILPLNGVLNNVVLTPAALPGGGGADFFLLQVLFYQEINGSSYSLKNGEYNSLGIVELG